MSKTQQRVLTAVGVVLGLVVGFVVFRRVIADKEGVLEIGDFLLGVFIGGGIGMIIYTLIKDGVPRLLRARRDKEPRAPKPERQPRQVRVAAPEPAAPEPEKARRKEPLRAAGRERPLRIERPLKPRD